jgi:hypothetical protein
LDALFILLIYLVPFCILGFVAKKLMSKHGTALTDVQEQAGPNRRKGLQFLLGFWRRED